MMSDNLASAVAADPLMRRPPQATPAWSRSAAAPAFYGLLAAVVVAAGWLLDDRPMVVLITGAAAALVGAFMLRLAPAHLARGLVLVATTALVLANLSALGTAGRLWGLSAIAICMGVFLLLPLGSLPVFPLLHLFCLVQAIYLFVSVLVSRRPPGVEIRFSDQMRVDGFALTMLFMGVLALSGIAATRLLSGRRQRQAVVEERTLTGRAAATLVGGTIASIALSQTSLQPRLGALAQLVTLVPILGGLALADLWLRKELELRFKVLLVVAAVTYALAGVGTGLLYAAAGPFIAALALVVTRRRGIPWAVLSAVVVAVVLLNAGKAEFRKQYAADAPGGGIARGPAYLALTATTVRGLDATSVAESAYRFSTSDVLGYMRYHVPSRYPYWDKRTYRGLPFALLPRVIVPFKPKLDFSNEFGRQYGILDQSDNVTSENIPLSVEAFVNYGVPGLIGVGAVAGVFLAWVGSLASARRTADVILAALIATQAIAGIESGVTALALVVPFLFILRPVSRWLVQADRPAGRRRTSGATA